MGRRVRQVEFIGWESHEGGHGDMELVAEVQWHSRNKMMLA